MRRLATVLLIGFVFLISIVPSWFGLFNDYIQLVIILIGINVTLAVSLNLINGYMGEFSVGHAAFMGVGAYIASVLSVSLVTESTVFGAALLAEGWSLLVFPLVLVIGGIIASLFSLIVAIPSFRTRGDYLAIITLAANFIFKSLVENMDKIGGPRGFMGMGKVTRAMENTLDLPWVMLWTFVAALLTIYIVSNFVSSIFGKGIVAVRDDEIAAELMTVNTRRVKVVTFMLGCGLAGIAGGLHAHAIGYINPSSYFIMQSVNIMVMVYLGGMSSISGSVISAIGFTILLEILRPLELFRWVVTPLLLILLMLFRPSGIMGSRELTDIFPRLRKIFGTTDETITERLSHVSASD